MARSWSENLLRWYAKYKRPLPWRDHPDPYAIWVSEVMLQQTRVDTVLPYYRRFLARFPTIRRLASAELESILKVWEGLGYYSRARRMQQAAVRLVEEYEGRLPSSHSELLTLPGFGPYIAAAVASIAFGLPVPVVDGNVLRVVARLFGDAADIAKASTRRKVERRLAPIVRRHPPASFNQALMELGALVCRPRAPDCAACPIRRDCRAEREGRVTDLPRKSRRGRLPHYDIAVGVIWKKGRFLITRRRDEQMLGGLWEFPGGKHADGESLEKTACREILEETGLKVRVHEPLACIRHAYSHFRITLTAFRCEVVSGRLRLHSAQAAAWVTPEELAHYPMPRANRTIAQVLARY